MPDFTREEIEELLETYHKLFGADLKGIDLSEVNLYRANLSKANLHGAELLGADLRNADLNGVYLFETNLRLAWYNSDTNFPEDFDPEAAGMVLVE